LTKLNAQQATYMSKSSAILNIMYGSDRNSSFVKQGAHENFLCFSKGKSLELWYHLEQDKQ
jgi:hypothetical protein